jgi:hypothetical protein
MANTGDWVLTNLASEMICESPILSEPGAGR